MSALEQAVPKGYKQTEVGVIPEDWKCISIGDLNPFVTSGSRGWATYYSEVGDPFVRITNMERSSIYLNMENTKFVSLPPDSAEGRRTSLKNTDILISITADIGICSYVDEKLAKPAFINQHIALIRFENKPVNSKFIAYFLSSEAVQKLFQGSADQGAKAGMNLDSIRKIKTALPELREQTAIANALSDVDALLTELEKLIAKKQAIKTATMQQLLTGKTRLPQFATYTEGEKQGQPKGTKTSELGEIPEDWDVRPIESVIEDLRGGAPFKPSDFTNAGVKVLPKGGVVRGGVLRIHEKDQQFCSKGWSLKYAKNGVDNRYTIVVLRDLVPSGPSIGLMVNIPTDEKYVLAQGVYGFIADDKETSNYLIQYSNTTQYRKAANEIMVGSTQVHITNGAFKALKVPLPPKEERGAIATILSDMDNEIQTLEQRLAKTRQIKQGMMQALLTGRTRLPINEQAEV
jgi:type I restriction enzyme S subunit